MTAALGILAVLAAGAATVLAIRIGGLREQLALERDALFDARGALDLAVAEVAEERRRQAELDTHRARELGEVEDALAEALRRCEDPGVARGWFDRVLRRSEQ